MVYIVLSILSFLLWVTLIGAVILAIKRRPAWKRWLAGTGIVFVLIVVCAVVGVDKAPAPDKAVSPKSAAQVEVSTAPLSITTSSLPGGVVGGSYKASGDIMVGVIGDRYEASLSATGGTPPYSWSLAAGKLPPGLSLSRDGTISGTPTAAGTYSFTVQVWDSQRPAQTVQRPLSIAIDEAYPAKTPVLVGKWVVAAGIDPGVQFKDKLGDEFFNIKADAGYTYALVPVAVKNTSNQTESLVLVFWKLSDNAGRVYEIETMADLYLPEKTRLDVTGVPPEATRTGYLVFQVKKDAGSLALSMQTTLKEVKWKIK